MLILVCADFQSGSQRIIPARRRERLIIHPPSVRHEAIRLARLLFSGRAAIPGGRAVLWLRADRRSDQAHTEQTGQRPQVAVLRRVVPCGIPGPPRACLPDRLTPSPSVRMTARPSGQPGMAAQGGRGDTQHQRQRTMRNRSQRKTLLMSGGDEWVKVSAGREESLTRIGRYDKSSTDSFSDVL